MQETEYTRLLQEVYTDYWQNPEHIEESPRIAGRRMAQVLAQTIQIAHETKMEVTALDLCSGPGTLFRNLLTTYPSRARYTHFITQDIISFSQEQQFTARVSTDVPIRHTHLTGSALQVSLPDGSVDVLTSHFGIDFLERDVFLEVRRLLAPDGVGLFHFHHPVIYNQISESKPEHEALYRYMEETNRIFRNEQEIEETLTRYRLLSTDVFEWSATTWEGEVAWWFTRVRQSIEL